ncbi:DUF6247 family protein [Kribbella sp. NPDC006257]|uniref:DUF6247 family protein n=1 Tax=Kribbella sp. NPDC006257 TaxID=3156738 RepID=UPI0033A4F472
MREPFDDPGEILRALPVRWREQFLSEYHAALDDAREVSRFRQLREVLHLWRLRAIAYSGPGFDAAMQAARDGRADEFVPADQVIPGWLDRT